MHSVSQIVKKNPSITYCTDGTLCGWGAFQDTFSKGVGGGGGECETSIPVYRTNKMKNTVTVKTDY